MVESIDQMTISFKFQMKRGKFPTFLPKRQFGMVHTYSRRVGTDWVRHPMDRGSKKKKTPKKNNFYSSLFSLGVDSFPK